MIEYNLMRVFFLLVLMCFVQPMSEESTTFLHRILNQVNRAQSIAFSGKTETETEDFRIGTQGQHSHYHSMRTASIATKTRSITTEFTPIATKQSYLTKPRSTSIITKTEYIATKPTSLVTRHKSSVPYSTSQVTVDTQTNLKDLRKSKGTYFQYPSDIDTIINSRKRKQHFISGAIASGEVKPQPMLKSQLLWKPSRLKMFPNSLKSKGPHDEKSRDFVTSPDAGSNEGSTEKYAPKTSLLKSLLFPGRRGNHGKVKDYKRMKRSVEGANPAEEELSSGQEMMTSQNDESNTQKNMTSRNHLSSSQDGMTSSSGVVNITEEDIGSGYVNSSSGNPSSEDFLFEHSPPGDDSYADARHPSGNENFSGAELPSLAEGSGMSIEESSSTSNSSSESLSSGIHSSGSDASTSGFDGSQTSISSKPEVSNPNSTDLLEVNTEGHRSTGREETSGSESFTNLTPGGTTETTVFTTDPTRPSAFPREHPIRHAASHLSSASARSTRGSDQGAPQPIDGRDVCNTCRGARRANNLKISQELLTRGRVKVTGRGHRVSPEKYRDIANAANHGKIATKDLLNIYKQRRWNIRWNTTSAALKRKQYQDFRLPPNPRTSMRRIKAQLSTQEGEERYIRRQYSNLAIGLAHFRYARADEEADSKVIRGTLVDTFCHYEIQDLQKTLCWLDQLPWKRRFSCELAMQRYNISASYLDEHRESKSERNYSHVILFDYMKRTFQNIERFFLCLSRGSKCFQRVSSTVLIPWTEDPGASRESSVQS